MNASKTLTSAITAATILGAVSFVYAQTRQDSTAPATDRTTQQMQTPATQVATPDASTNSNSTSTDMTARTQKPNRN